MMTGGPDLEGWQARRRRSALLASMVAMFLGVFIARSAAAGANSPLLALWLVFAALAGFAMVITRRFRRGLPLDALTQHHARQLRLRQERAILKVVAENAGRVTPTQAAMAGEDLSLDEAKAILDDLASRGHCAFDSDERGTVYYDFNVTPTPLGGLTPEQWVEQASARMSGEEAAESVTSRN